MTSSWSFIRQLKLYVYLCPVTQALKNIYFPFLSLLAIIAEQNADRSNSSKLLLDYLRHLHKENQRNGVDESNKLLNIWVPLFTVIIPKTSFPTSWRTLSARSVKITQLKLFREESVFLTIIIRNKYTVWEKCKAGKLNSMWRIQLPAEFKRLTQFNFRIHPSDTRSPITTSLVN